MSFHYIIEQSVCFMTIVESTFNSKVAFHYLDDLQKEFWQSHGEHFRSVNNDRLRAFHMQIKFERFVEKTKSVYLDSRSSHHLAKLNEDLSSTVDVMKTTVDAMMTRGSSLDGLSKTSSDIVAGSRQFKTSAQELEFALKLKQFAPLALMIFLIFLLVYMVPFITIFCFYFFASFSPSLSRSLPQILTFLFFSGLQKDCGMKCYL
jgi:vesicle transport protein SEC22